MRTAEEIMDGYFKEQAVKPSDEIECSDVIECMKRYAKEAIIEAANVAEAEITFGEFAIVNKQSILKLIDELK